ncbi:MAG: FMN-binding glutamate synthase family protein [Patescibacteria group bacterium]|nr:FMN-binding glutamate synthase family protein [Patescibacteria group bacterium]
MDQNLVREIQKRTKQVSVSSGRSNKLGRISFDDLVFVPAQLNKRPVDYYRETITTESVVGKNSKKPVTIQTPIVFGAMSFGSLSKEAKIVLAKASKLAGTIANTGEGGMLNEEREFAGNLTIQYSTGRFGISEEILKKADVIEVKIGQGAKGGMGGLLPADKVTEEVARVRKIEMGKDIHSPAYHQDIKDIKELKQRIEKLRKITGGVPIIIKIAAGDIEKDLPLAVQTNSDIIAIDGMEGGTGAAPTTVLNDMGIPTLAALVKAREVLDKINAKQELWIGGGLNKPADFAKALALGADKVFCGSALLIAMGCIQCGLCYLGKCPKGIATQDKELRRKLDVDQAASNVANFIKNSTEEIKMVAGACGENNIFNLNKGHLRALSLEISKISKVKFIGE